MSNFFQNIKKAFLPFIKNEVSKFKKPFFIEIENAAKQEGKSQTSIKITKKHPAIVWILSKCYAFFQSKANSILDQLEETLSKYKQILNDFFKNNTLEDLVHEKEQLYEKLQLKVIQINSHFGVQKEAIQKQIDEVTKLLNHDRIEVQNYAKINIRWKLFVASVLITGIVFGETFTNQQAFLAIPKQSFITTLFAAIAISFGTYAMGALFVKVVRNTEYSELKKAVSGISIIAIVLFAYWSIGNFRQSAMSAVQASAEGREALEIAPFTFLTINALLFFGLIGIKLAIYPSRKVIENNKKHNDLKRKIKEKDAKIKRHNDDLNELEERKEKEKKKASQEYEELIEKIDQIVSKHYNALKEQQTIYNKKLAFGNCFYQEMCSISQEAIGLFAQQVGLYQGNLNELTVDIDTTEFKNPFSKFQPIYDNEIKSMFNPIKTKNYEKSHPFTFHKN